MSHMDQNCFSAPSYEVANEAVSILRGVLAGVADKITVDNGTPRVVVHARAPLPEHVVEKIQKAGLG